MFSDELIHDVLLSRILIDGQVQDLLLQAEVKRVFEVEEDDVERIEDAVVACWRWWWARWRRFQL